MSILILVANQIKYVNRGGSIMRKIFTFLLIFVLQATPVLADEAYDAYKIGNYTTAFKLYSDRARSGDVIAQFYVAYMYDEGLGVYKDDTTAVYWYRKAADNGYEKAMASMGYMYSSGEGVPLDYTQALYWSQKAANNGSAEGQRILGWLYEHGKGVSEDKAQAIYWYRKAAEKGEKTAKKRLTELEKKNQVKTRSQYTGNISYETLPQSFGNYHAIIIGNNDYTYLPKLSTAVNDAKTVASLLGKKYNFKVTQILNATRSDILSVLRKMRLELKGSDNLLIYYAGHGFFDKEIQRGYWLPVNAERNNKTNWIPNEDITGELKAIAANHVLIVADSCYSGTLTRGASLASMRSGPLEEWVRRMAKRQSRTVLTSGALEPVLDSGGEGHSIFAQSFLRALQENQQIIVMDDLYDSIRQYVVVNARQTPLYSTIRFAGHDNGDFIFVPH